MSILLQKKNVGDYSYMSSPNIYYRALKNRHTQTYSIHDESSLLEILFMYA